MFKQFHFSPGDKLDFLARVEENHWRILFQRLRQYKFSSHQDNPGWNESQLVVTISTASELSRQFDKCRYSSHGVSIDIKQDHESSDFTRRMYCLEG